MLAEAVLEQNANFQWAECVSMLMFSGSWRGRVFWEWITWNAELLLKLLKLIINHKYWPHNEFRQLSCCPVRILLRPAESTILFVLTQINRCKASFKHAGTGAVNAVFSGIGFTAVLSILNTGRNHIIQVGSYTCRYFFISHSGFWLHLKSD